MDFEKEVDRELKEAVGDKPDKDINLIIISEIKEGLNNYQKIYAPARAKLYHLYGARSSFNLSAVDEEYARALKEMINQEQIRINKIHKKLRELEQLSALSLAQRHLENVRINEMIQRETDDWDY